MRKDDLCIYLVKVQNTNPPSGFVQQLLIVLTSGDNGKEVPPVPIPNTAVKLLSADNTWRAAAREDRTLPEQKREVQSAKDIV